MNTLRLSVAAFMLAAVGAAVALLLAKKGGAGRQGDPLRAAGGARAGDRADLLSRSQDMVSEGGPAGEPHSQDP